MLDRAPVILQVTRPVIDVYIDVYSLAVHGWLLEIIPRYQFNLGACLMKSKAEEVSHQIQQQGKDCLRGRAPSMPQASLFLESQVSGHAYQGERCQRSSPGESLGMGFKLEKSMR